MLYRKIEDPAAGEFGSWNLDFRYLGIFIFRYLGVLSFSALPHSRMPNGKLNDTPSDKPNGRLNDMPSGRHHDKQCEHSKHCDTHLMLQRLNNSLSALRKQPGQIRFH